MYSATSRHAEMARLYHLPRKPPRLLTGPSVLRLAARPARPAHLSRLARQPPRVGQRAPQQELDTFVIVPRVRQVLRAAFGV
jgi:hypothetical protein